MIFIAAIQMEETAQYFDRRFFLNRFQIFIALPKFYATHRNYENFVKITGPYCPASIFKLKPPAFLF
jgi:hypothetical protein